MDARVDISTRTNRTISEVKLSVTFYSLLTSFRVVSRVDIWVGARVDVSTRMNRTIGEVKFCVKFYSLLTSFKVNVRVDARVDVSTQTK